MYHYFKIAKHCYIAMLSQFMLLKQSVVQIVTQSLIPVHCVSNYLCMHHASIHVAMCVYVHACSMHVCMYVYVCTSMYSCIHVSMHVHNI